MRASFPTRLRKTSKKRVLPVLHRLAPGLFILAFSISSFAAPTLTLSSAAGGIVVGGNAGSLGNVNGLGVGTVSAGVSLDASGPTNAVFYYTPVNVRISGLTGTGKLTVDDSNNFSNTAILAGYSCVSSCTSFANFTKLPTSAAGTTLGTGIANNSTVEVWVGATVSNKNGANAFTGTDSIQIKFTAKDSSGGSTNTVTLTLNVNMQDALEMTLSPAAGGLSVSLGSDFAMDFQNVNGLGINPATGLTAASVSGGYVYVTPYTITPVFAGFSQNKAAIQVQLMTAFIAPTMIYLEDAAAAGGPYTQITTTAISISANAKTDTDVTRYLGLFVSNANGAGTFTGTDSSSLSYILTAP
ncbi:MAG TPA: hypothetical protein VGK48_15020 [Terriglobia bacterium]|jgi:hypothetical protein